MKYDGDPYCGCEGQVSIIVPCYNAEATLAATLQTAVAQVRVRDIVVIDDGSSDSTLALARVFEPQCAPSQGLTRASRQHAIGASRKLQANGCFSWTRTTC